MSVLPKIIKTAFAMVHLIYFFTAGPDEVRGWCCRKGFKAPQVRQRPAFVRGGVLVGVLGRCAQEDCAEMC